MKGGPFRSTCITMFSSSVDPVNDDCSRVELEAGFEGAFEGFHHSGGHMDIGNDPFQGVEPMGTYYTSNLIQTLFVTLFHNHGYMYSVLYTCFST